MNILAGIVMEMPLKYFREGKKHICNHGYNFITINKYIQLLHIQYYLVFRSISSVKYKLDTLHEPVQSASGQHGHPVNFCCESIL